MPAGNYRLMMRKRLAEVRARILDRRLKLESITHDIIYQLRELDLLCEAIQEIRQSLDKAPAEGDE